MNTGVYVYRDPRITMRYLDIYIYIHVHSVLIVLLRYTTNTVCVKLNMKKPMLTCLFLLTGTGHPRADAE